MNAFWIYLISALLSALPVLWLMAGAWMGAPVVATEYASLLGSCLLFIAAHVSLFKRTRAALLSLVGIAGVLSFWIVEPLRSVLHGDGVGAGELIASVITLLSLSAAWVAVGDLRHSRATIASTRQRRITLGVSACCIAILMGGILWQNERSKRTPSRYILPDGYIGWAKIHFGAPGVLPRHQSAMELMSFGLPSRGNSTQVRNHNSVARRTTMSMCPLMEREGRFQTLVWVKVAWSGMRVAGHSRNRARGRIDQSSFSLVQNPSCTRLAKNERSLVTCGTFCSAAPRRGLASVWRGVRRLWIRGIRGRFPCLRGVRRCLRRGRRSGVRAAGSCG